LKLSDAVRVAPRYARAVNLVRDVGGLSGVEGYTVTRTGRDFLRQLRASFEEGAGHRA